MKKSYFFIAIPFILLGLAIYFVSQIAKFAGTGIYHSKCFDATKIQNIVANSDEDVSKSCIFLVEKGHGINTILAKLKKQGYKIKLGSAPKIYLKLKFQGKQLNYGEYLITRRDTILSFLHKVHKGKGVVRYITFVEGETASTYQAQINKAYGLAGELTTDIPEGYAMPNTYNYIYGETKNAIAARIIKSMHDYIDTLEGKIKQSDYLKNKEELIIMASIIEKEAANEAEKPIIASVFKNRILKGMKLQTDPSVIYEITRGKYKLDRRLTKADLLNGNTYNTYKIKGLPAGPIANPSKSSIDAALNPANTDFLFFVLKPSLGLHVFSKDYRQHQQNAKEYQAS